MVKVFIGVGHGGSDSGAVGNGFEEKQLNLAIALACKEELTRHNVSVMLSREGDEADTVTDEVKECNSFNPNVAVEIHNNSCGGDGAEAYYHFKGGSGKVLAEKIIDEIMGIGQNSRGAKTRTNSNGKDYYAFIRETKCPAVIVECSFLDNENDVQIINTAEKQKAMGIAIAHGILKTFCIEIKALYKVQVGAFVKLSNAKEMVARLENDGYDACIVNSK